MCNVYCPCDGTHQLCFAYYLIFHSKEASACYLIKSSFNCLPTLNGQIVIWNYHLLRLLLTIYRLIYLPAKSNWIVSFGIESEHKTRGNNKKTTKIPNESRFGYRISTLFAHQAVLLVFYGSYVFVCVSWKMRKTATIESNQSAVNKW